MRVCPLLTSQQPQRQASSIQNGAVPSSPSLRPSQHLGPASLPEGLDQSGGPVARTRGSAKHQPIQGTGPEESQQAGSKYLIPLIKQHHTLETKHLMAFRDGEFGDFPLDESKIQGLDLEPQESPDLLAQKTNMITAVTKPVACKLFVTCFISNFQILYFTSDCWSSLSTLYWRIEWLIYSLTSKQPIFQTFQKKLREIKPTTYLGNGCKQLLRTNSRGFLWLLSKKKNKKKLLGGKNWCTIAWCRICGTVPSTTTSTNTLGKQFKKQIQKDYKIKSQQVYWAQVPTEDQSLRIRRITAISVSLIQNNAEQKVKE